MDGNEDDNLFDDEGDDIFGIDPTEPHPRIHQYEGNAELWAGWVYTVVFIFIYVYGRSFKMTHLLKANLKEIWSNGVSPEQGAAWLADALQIAPPKETHNEN